MVAKESQIQPVSDSEQNVNRDLSLHDVKSIPTGMSGGSIPSFFLGLVLGIVK